jgi:hypothetical protein
MSDERFKFSDRVKQKALSRDRDEARLKSGEVTTSELRKENAFIKGSGFAKKKIGFSPKCRPKNGDKYFTDRSAEIKGASGAKPGGSGEAD